MMRGWLSSGINRSGHAFQEISSVRDVSSGGISFTLHTSMNQESLSTSASALDLGRRRLPSRNFKPRRESSVSCEGDRNDGFVVAARFEGNV